jgi:hypothetical protein
VAVVRLAFGEGRMKCTWVLEWKNANSQRTKEAKQMKSEVSSIPIIFFDIKGIAHKEFDLSG